MATQDSINHWLAEGIKAARNQNAKRARELFFQVVDTEPRHEMAWLWLSAVMENDTDRRICLENVLTVNPRNSYAQRGIEKLTKLSRPKIVAATSSMGAAATASLATTVGMGNKATSRPLTLWLIAAFWAGLSFLFLIGGLFGLVEWGMAWLNSRIPLNQLRPFQIVDLLVIIIFLIGGVMAVNVALALYRRLRSGFYGSLIMALGLLLAGPTAGLLLDPPNFLLSTFLGMMPAVVVFLTLASQACFEPVKTNDHTLVSHTR